MMDHASDSSHNRQTTTAIDAATVAIAGGAAVAALAACLARPARRSSAADEKHQALVAYRRLESTALRQREAVEARRRALAATTFPTFTLDVELGRGRPTATLVPPTHL